MAVAVVVSVTLLVMLVAGLDPRAENRVNVACARQVITYMSEIERLITAPGVHGAARRSTLEDRLERACLRPR